MERSASDVDAFIASFDGEIREDMVALDELIADVMDGQARELYEGRFWGGTDQRIVGYGRLTSRRADGSEVHWFVVGLARQRRHFSVYVSAVEDGRYLAEAYGDAIGKVRVGKSVIGFASVADIDLPALRKLLERARDITAIDRAED